MWKRLMTWIWFINTLFFEQIVSPKEETVSLKIVDKVPRKRKFFWWCGYCVIGQDTKISKVFREKYYTRYTIRYQQAIEFESWVYYYLVLTWQFLCGKPWISWKGAYYTCPFIVESLYYENKPESIFYVYPYGRYKNFIIPNRQGAWKEGRKYWKTWIRQNYEQGKMGED